VNPPVSQKNVFPLTSGGNSGRRVLGEAGISEATLLEKLQIAQNDNFKARQDNANKDIISQRYIPHKERLMSLLRVNPTLKTVHATRNTLNSAERGLFSPIVRRDILASQLLKISEEHSKLSDELAELQVHTLSITPSFEVDEML
jgi:hypothetical protein